MENRLYDNEFEDFLKNHANQHRMYPSDKVWRNIQGEVHGYRKWPALTVIAVFIIAALVVGTVAVKPHTELAKLQTLAVSTTSDPILSESKKADPIDIDDKSYAIHSSVNNLTQQTIAKVNETIKVAESEELLIVTSSNTLAINNTNPALSKTVIQPDLATESSIAENTPDNKTVTFPYDLAKTNSLNTALHNAILPAKNTFSNNFELANLPYNFSNAVYKENYYSFGRNNTDQVTIDFNSTPVNTSSGSPLSRIGKKSSKLDFEFYVTPSISYRRLVDDAEGSLTKSYVTALPYEANYVVDVNHVVQHRPAAGYEIGFSLGYNLGKKFAIRSGFQFNTRQYNIDAFVHSSEPATVALSADNSNLVLNTVSGFRNIDGSKPIELKNRYYEIALPIGIDWRPVNKKFAWGIAASVQPTYTFDKEPFIITSNYKNYADGSQLMRNWNINANIETYLGYNTGKYRWQIGPQLRYQFMPTMANSFPIREYPVDLGIKLGLIRSLR